MIREVKLQGSFLQIQQMLNLLNHSQTSKFWAHVIRLRLPIL